MLTAYAWATASEVKLTGGASKAGEEAELGFQVTLERRDRSRSTTTSAPRATWSRCATADLAYLHVHPAEGGHEAKATDDEHAGESEDEHSGSEPEAGGEPIKFATEFPSDGRYGLFLQFKHEGKVRTAAFTRQVGEMTALLSDWI